MNQDSGSSVRRLRRVLAEELAKLLLNVRVGESLSLDPAGTACGCLELLIPKELSAVYPEWASESLDGVFVLSAVRAELNLIEVVAACILITDQTLSPLRLDLRLAEAGHDLAEMRIRIGEPGGGALRVSGPRYDPARATEFLRQLGPRLEAIPWVYDWVG